MEQIRETDYLEPASQGLGTEFSRVSEKAGRVRAVYSEKVSQISQLVRNNKKLINLEAMARKAYDLRDDALVASRAKMSKIFVPFVEMYKKESIPFETLLKRKGGDFNKVINSAAKSNLTWSKVAKVGRGLGVLGLGVSGVYAANEIYNAEDKVAETLTQGSILGGAVTLGATGAVAGILCGPVAFVCSPVLAIGGLIVGGIVGEEASSYYAKPISNTLNEIIKK